MKSKDKTIRREFITKVTAGVTLGASILSAASYNRILGANDKVNMGFIGLGHRSTSFAHLANIALAIHERLQWDPEKERFTNSEAANKLLHYEYRSPWKL